MKTIEIFRRNGLRRAFVAIILATGLSTTSWAFEGNALERWMVGQTDKEKSRIGVATPKKKTTIVSKNFLWRSGKILEDVESIGSIIGTKNPRVTMGMGETVFINLSETDGARIGKRYSIVRAERPVYHPGSRKSFFEPEGRSFMYDRSSDSIFLASERSKKESDLKNWLAPDKKLVGHIVRAMGVLEVVETGPEMSRAVIMKSFAYIKKGDRLMPYEKPVELTEEDYKADPDKKIEAVVLAFRDDTSIAGMEEVAFIDKGSDDGVVPGDWFGVTDTPEESKKVYGNYTYKIETSPMLPVTVGVMRIIATEAKTSTAIILKNSRAIFPGQTVRYLPSLKKKKIPTRPGF